MSQPAKWAAETPEAYRRELRAAAIPCTVVVLRRDGIRIPAAELLQIDHPSGLLVCDDLHTTPAWYACLYGDATMAREVLPRLQSAILERENAGVRLYRGLEIEGPRSRRQAWLCTPTPGRAREILKDIQKQEAGGRAWRN